MNDEPGTNDVEDRFHRGMADVYQQAKDECDYTATRFLQMLAEQGGLGTARTLLGDSKTSDGFTALRKCGCLHLTVENLVLRSEFQELFTPAERETALNRLKLRGFDPAGLATGQEMKVPKGFSPTAPDRRCAPASV